MRSPWFEGLLVQQPETAELVAAAIDLLTEKGPALGRPIVDSIDGSSLPNLKEFTLGSRGRSEIRILFAFDPARQAVLLPAGDKAGAWKLWYARNIPIAESRFERWLAGDYNEER